MAAEDIARKDWYWILYRSTDGLLLSVLCGTIGMYELTVRLSEAEEASYRADAGYLDELAAAIRYAPDSYRERRIPTFKP